MAIMVAFVTALGVMYDGIAASLATTVLDCHYSGDGAHTHVSDCYDENGVLVCPLVERELHVHDDSCYKEEPVLVCENVDDDHEHDDSCYDVVRTLVCGKEEVTEEHVHGDGCFRVVEVEVADDEVAMPATSLSHEFVDGDGHLVARVDAEVPEGVLPEGAALSCSWVGSLTKSESKAVDAVVDEAADGVALQTSAFRVGFVDSSGVEVRPEGDVRLSVTSSMHDLAESTHVTLLDDMDEGAARRRDDLLERMAQEGRSEDDATSKERKLLDPARSAASADLLATSDLSVGEADFDVSSAETVVVTVTSREVEMASRGDSVSIDVVAGADAGISAGSSVMASEVAHDSDAYASYLAQVEGLLPDGQKVALARFFDMHIEDGEGNVETPLAGVDVSVTLADAPGEYASVSAYHFSDGLEQVDVSESGGTSSFVADGFSVWGVVYTVDFSYGEAGEAKVASLVGGTSMGLIQLVDELGINSKSGMDATEFVRHVTDVSSSDASKVFVEKVDGETWQWKIESDNGLELSPSAELGQDFCEAQLTHFVEPDWAIVSVCSFDTVETLAITMDDGESYEVRMTDPADAVMVPDGSGGDVVQTIANPAGTTIDLFDYWIVDNLRDTWGRAGWPGHTGNDAFGYNFQFYDYNGRAVSGNHMSRDPDKDNDWYVDNGYLRGNGNDQGINLGHTFKFYPSTSGTVVDYGTKGRHVAGTSGAWTNNHDYYGTINGWTGNGDPTQGLVRGELVGGYPYVRADAGLGSVNESLGYLFDDSSHAGKQRYANVNDLLYVDPNGFYTYDSRFYSATYDGSASGGSFELREHAADAGIEQAGFWPFGDRIYWHGMHMSTDFSMPFGGRVLNPNGDYMDMEFTFSGDDDTWLYLDGMLIGDGGGIHNRTEIDVNFRTGKVTVYGNREENHTGGTLEQTLWLDDIYKAHGKYVAEDWEDVPGDEGLDEHGVRHQRYVSGSDHTFDMFYLERGGGESNLYIHYNLVSTADFTAHKSYYGEGGSTRLARDQFAFELVGFDGRWDSTNTQLLDEGAVAVMPEGGSASGAGTVADPYKEHLAADASGNPGRTVFRTGVSEDGNVNFGMAYITSDEMDRAHAGNPSTYRYMVREIVPPQAVNPDGVSWEQATEEQKAEGGFTYDGVTYDGRVYYWSATVREKVVTKYDGSTKTVYDIKKTRYVDSSYTTIDTETRFFSFVNGHVEPLSLVVNKRGGTGKALDGATFALTHARSSIVSGASGDEVRWAGRPEARTRTVVTSGGEATFADLVEGHYILEEVAPPAGYQAGEVTKWLVTLTKVDTDEGIELVPSIQALDENGAVPGDVDEVHPTVSPSGVFFHEVTNEKFPPSDIAVRKVWLASDGETPLSDEEIAALGDDIHVEGTLVRRVVGDAEVIDADPVVKVYARSTRGKTSYGRPLVEAVVSRGTPFTFSICPNNESTTNPQIVTEPSGLTILKSGATGVTYTGDYSTTKSGTANLFTIQHVNQDISIWANFGDYDFEGNAVTKSSVAQASNFGIYADYLEGSSVPTAVGTAGDEEVVGSIDLNAGNDWTQVWDAETLDEGDEDWSYAVTDIVENVDGFRRLGRVSTTYDEDEGVVTYTVTNVELPEMRELVVRKVWADGLDHDDDVVSYRISVVERDAEGSIVAGPYDYVEDGESEARTHELRASDDYRDVEWQATCGELPANNGYVKSDSRYREYEYGVYELGVEDGEYSVEYATVRDSFEGQPYSAEVIRNRRMGEDLSVRKLWVSEDGIDMSAQAPVGAYIAGKLVRDYAYDEDGGVTVRVMYRNNRNAYSGVAHTYEHVRIGSVITLFTSDAWNGAPTVTISGATFSRGDRLWGWFGPQSYLINVGTSDIDVTINFGNNDSGYYSADVDTSGGTGEHHEGTEDVGRFRLDAANGWSWSWWADGLGEVSGCDYTYRITDVREHAADGSVVEHLDGFDVPVVGSFEEVDDGSMIADITNVSTTSTAKVRIVKRDGSTDLPLEGASIRLVPVTEEGTLDDSRPTVGPVRTASDGNADFGDVVCGRYRVEEVDIPEGYVRLDGDMYIDVRIDGEDTVTVGAAVSGDVLAFDGLVADDGEQAAIHQYALLNYRGQSLPSTGGHVGLVVFAGLAMTLLAVSLLRQKRAGLWVNCE